MRAMQLNIKSSTILKTTVLFGLLFNLTLSVKAQTNSFIPNYIDTLDLIRKSTLLVMAETDFNDLNKVSWKEIQRIYKVTLLPVSSVGEGYLINIQKYNWSELEKYVYYNVLKKKEPYYGDSIVFDLGLSEDDFPEKYYTTLLNIIPDTCSINIFEDCDYLVGFDFKIGGVYRIKGFEVNEISEFLKMVYYDEPFSREVWGFWGLRTINIEYFHPSLVNFNPVLLKLLKRRKSWAKSPNCCSCSESGRHRYQLIH